MTSTSSDDWLPSLNGLRALSISMVIGSHFLTAHPELNRSPVIALLMDGALGVRIFFVISGFLITMLLLRELDQCNHVSLRNFYARRILRLWPVQFTFVLFLMYLTFVTPLNLNLCNYVTAVTFTKNYACSGWIDGHLWSLSVEEQFYLLWPLSIVTMRLKPLWTFAILLILIAPASRSAEYVLGGRIYAWLPSNTDTLMIGCLSAIYAQRHRATLERIAAWHPPAARIVATTILYVPIFLEHRMMFGKLTVTLGPTLQALCSAFLIISFVYHRQGISYRVLNWGLVSYIGTISYSLYIWQMPFLSKPDTFGGQNEWFLAFPVDLIAIAVIAMISYHVLEQPLAGLRHRLHHDGDQPTRGAAI